MLSNESLDFILYGAGEMARQIIVQYRLNKILIKSIVVTDTSVNPKMILGISVKSIEEFIDERRNVCVIIGVSEMYFDEVIKNLKNLGFCNIQIPKLVPMQYSNFLNSSKKDFLSMWYYLATKQQLDWDNIQTFNEKIQWLKLYDQNKKKTLCTDKYKVREYVIRKIGKKYLVPLIGVWDKFDNIDFEKLPHSFILKCNHGSGWNEIVTNKDMFCKNEAKIKFDLWMDTDFSDLCGLELQYKDIERKILAEKLLRMDGHKDIYDYKFFVFNGKVRLIQVDIDRSSNHRRNLYTKEWEILPYEILYKSDPEIVVQKPPCLDEMIQIAETLAEEFVHARVDLYFVNMKIYFGEITFTHGSGIEEFRPPLFGKKMGDWIRLPVYR